MAEWRDSYNEADYISPKEAIRLLADYFSANENIPAFLLLPPFLKIVSHEVHAASKEVKDPKLRACLNFYLSSMTFLGEVETEHQKKLMASAQIPNNCAGCGKCKEDEEKDKKGCKKGGPKKTKKSPGKGLDLFTRNGMNFN